MRFMLLAIFLAMIFLPNEVEAVKPPPPMTSGDNRYRVPPAQFRPPPPSHWVNRPLKKRPKNPDHRVRW